MVELAATRLEARLREQQDVLGAVRRPDGGAFFERNGLLFMPTGEVADTARKFREAQPVLGLLASDPSLRGVTQTLMVGVDAVQNRKAPVTALLPPMNMLSATLEDVFAGRFATMSWRALLMGQPAVDGGAGEAGSPARAFLTVDPKLDYNELQPGRAATDAIRQARAGREPARRIWRKGAADRAVCRSTTSSSSALSATGRCQSRRNGARGARHPVAGAALRLGSTSPVFVSLVRRLRRDCGRRAC